MEICPTHKSDQDTQGKIFGCTHRHRSIEHIEASGAFTSTGWKSSGRNNLASRDLPRRISQRCVTTQKDERDARAKAPYIFWNRGSSFTCSCQTHKLQVSIERSLRARVLCLETFAYALKTDPIVAPPIVHSS
eukprot:641282-Rhodomonas_salina.4